MGYSNWWLYFTQCYRDESQKKIMNNYCGDYERDDNSQIELINNEGYFGTKNLYCTWEIINPENASVKTLTFRSYARQRMISTMAFMIYYRTGLRQYQIVNYRYFKWAIPSNVEKVVFHYYTTTGFDYSPLVIDVNKVEPPTNYVLLIIVIGSSLFTCLLVSMVMFKLVKNCMMNGRGIVERPRSRDIDEYVNRISEHDRKRQNQQKLDELFTGELKAKSFGEVGKLNMFNNNCTICLEEFMNTSEIICLDCKHAFHSSCLKDWLNKNLLNPKCPNCNYCVIEQRVGNSNSGQYEDNNRNRNTRDVRYNSHAVNNDNVNVEINANINGNINHNNSNRNNIPANNNNSNNQNQSSIANNSGSNINSNAPVNQILPVARNSTVQELDTYSEINNNIINIDNNPIRDLNTIDNHPNIIANEINIEDITQNNIILSENKISTNTTIIQINSKKNSTINNENETAQISRGRSNSKNDEDKISK